MLMSYHVKTMGADNVREQCQLDFFSFQKLKETLFIQPMPDTVLLINDIAQSMCVTPSYVYIFCSL